MQRRQEDVGHLLKIVTDRLKAHADEAHKKTGLTASQTQALRFIQMHGGKITQKELENFLNVSHPTVAGIVSRMEKKGFLTCYMDPSDRRNKIVCSTEKADAIDAKMRAGLAEMEARLLRSFTEEDIDTLRELLRRLYHNLD